MAVERKRKYGKRDTWKIGWGERKRGVAEVEEDGGEEEVDDGQ